MSLDKWTYVEAEGLWMSPKGRSTFVALERKFKNKKSTRADDQGQYAVTLIFPPSIDHKPIKDALQEVVKEGFPGGDLFNPAKSKVKGLKNPLRKADEVVADITSKGEEVDLEGWMMIRANSFRSRPVVRNSRGEVVDEDDLAVEAYSGRWMRILVRPATYNNESIGAKFYLEGVQLLANDDAIGGFKQSDGSAFTPVDDEGEDDI
jgi:hypothetical protein